MAESKLHKPTPLEEFMQQSIPSEHPFQQPAPVRYSPSTRTVGGTVAPSPGGAPSQETRIDIGEQAAQENISRQMVPGPQPRDEIRPGPEIPGAIKPATREELMGPATGEVQTPGPATGPVIERRFSGQETISTEEQQEQFLLQEMGRKQYETPLRHSMMVSEALVGKPEEHRDPAAQVISTGVEFVITLPAHTLMAPVEIPKTAISTGRAVQEKGFVPWFQESIRYIGEKPGVRATQLILVAGTMLLPVGAKLIKGRMAKTSVSARAIETDLLFERGGDWVIGKAKTDITYSTGKKSLIYTEAVSKRVGKKGDLIDTRARSLGLEKDMISTVESRSMYREGDIRPFRDISAEATATKIKSGGFNIESKIHESGGIVKDIIDPGLDTHFKVTRTTPVRGKPTGVIDTGVTRTVIEVDAGKMVYKKRVGGELISEIDLKKISVEPSIEKVVRPGPAAPSGKRITTETIGKTSLDIHTESAMSRQIDQVSKIRPRTSVSQTRVAPGPVTTTAGPESPLEIRGYPGATVTYPAATRSGWEKVGVVREGPGISGSGRITRMDHELAVAGVFRVRSLTGQRQLQGQRMDQAQVMQQVSMTDQITQSGLRQGIAQAQQPARTTRSEMLQELKLDLILRPPTPIMPPRAGRGGPGPPFIIFIGDVTGKDRGLRIKSDMGKAGFRYQPTLGGLISGETIARVPKGPFTGLERRYPVKRKKKKKK